MTILMLLILLSLPSRTQAQLQSGIIVFDPSNFVKNSITAAQMIKQIELMLRNLIAK